MSEFDVYPANQYIIKEHRTSIVNPTQRFTIETGIKCPRCATILPPLEHGAEQQCGGCGYFMERLGNGLIVWPYFERKPTPGEVNDKVKKMSAR